MSASGPQVVNVNALNAQLFAVLRNYRPEEEKVVEITGLLAAGADPNASNILPPNAQGNELSEYLQRNRPLHIAARNGHVRVMGLLINGIVKNWVPENYFEFSVNFRKQVETLMVLWRRTCGTDQEQNFGQLPPALMFEIFNQLSNGANVNALNAGGHTALVNAAYEGHVDAIKMLFDAGAHINGTGTLYGDTALHIAARCGKVDAVRALLELGADVNAVSEDGETALHQAAAFGKVEPVRILLNAGAFVNVKGGRNHETALEMAKRYDHKNVITVLEAVMDARAAGWKPETHWAFPKSVRDAVEALILEWSRINAENWEASRTKRPIEPSVIGEIPFELICAIAEYVAATINDK
jgi:ankyrin repeat protein